LLRRWKKWRLREVEEASVDDKMALRIEDKLTVDYMTTFQE